MALPVDFYIGSPGAAVNLRSRDDLKLNMTKGEHGDLELRFDLCDWQGIPPRLGDRVALVDNTYGYFWSGYLGAPTLGMFGGQSTTRMVARGWRQTMADDGWEVTKVWAEGTPLSTVVMEALSKCSWIGAGIPLPGGLAFQLYQDSQEFILRTPDDVFNFVQARFTNLGTPLLWEVKQHDGHPMSEDPSFYMRFVDTAPRYFVHLTDKDDFNPTYDRDTVFNKAIVGWSPKLAEDVIATPGSELYKVIPQIRAKRVNASVDMTTQQDALNTAGYLIQRNNTLRPVNTTMVIHCDTPIRAIWPAAPAQTENWPHYLVQANRAIRILNDVSGWGPYGITDYWIASVSYDFDSGSLSLSIGDPIAQDDFALQQSYDTNRTMTAIDSGVVSQSLRDADVLQVIGPDKAGDVPPTIGQVIPMAYLDEAGNFISIVDPDKPALPYKAVIHPKILPDYGVQANFGREADSIGTKGFIQVVPCLVLAWNVCFTPPAGSDTVPTDSITVQLYPTYPFTVDVDVLATCTLAAAQCGSGTIAPTPSSLALFQQRGKIGVRVSSAGSVAGSGFQVSVTGKKVYPDLGVTT